MSTTRKVIIRVEFLLYALTSAWYVHNRFRPSIPVSRLARSSTRNSYFISCAHLCLSLRVPVVLDARFSSFQLMEFLRTEIMRAAGVTRSMTKRILVFVAAVVGTLWFINTMYPSSGRRFIALRALLSRPCGPLSGLKNSLGQHESPCQVWF